MIAKLYLVVIMVLIGVTVVRSEPIMTEEEKFIFDLIGSVASVSLIFFLLNFI